MILILADDLSGAAELAGIAAAHGLTAETQTQLNTTSPADLIAIDTESRSLNSSAAMRRVAQLYHQARPLNPNWIFKKTDSALRGNIAAELKTLSQAAKKPRTLFIPANPRKNRRIISGDYRINDIPIHQTIFAQDPEHPITTSNVAEAISPHPDFLSVNIHRHQPLPKTGFIIPDIENPKDIEQRANEADNNTLCAGAAEFFTALLKRFHPPKQPPAPPTIIPSGARLFICGSLAAWEQGIQTLAAQHQIPVNQLQPIQKWTQKSITDLNQTGRTMLAIGKPTEKNFQQTKSPPHQQLLKQLITTATTVIHAAQPPQIFLEGGATASATLKSMGWSRFQTIAANLNGIGSLTPLTGTYHPRLHIKPGSYQWPPTVWDKPKTNP